MRHRNEQQAHAGRGRQPRLTTGRGIGLIAAACVLTLAHASAQQLPDAPGKQMTVKLCGSCHPAERGAAVRLTREGWEDVIAKMVSLGAKGTDAEFEQVLDYLSTQFPGEAVAPLNLNRATSQELEALVGLFRRESAAWIAHRTKVGPCTTPDDLKKVSGLDFKKIDRRRDRLVCF